VVWDQQLIDQHILKPIVAALNALYPHQPQQLLRLSQVDLVVDYQVVEQDQHFEEPIPAQRISKF